LRDNTEGISLLTNIYGSEVVRDFQNSKYVEELELAGKLRFYQGKRYAYETWTDGGSSDQITVLPTNILERRIHNWRGQGAR
jgi:hypothetical protein